jgi:riboflavin kinase/FMN adenylyltransferase
MRVLRWPGEKGVDSGCSVVTLGVFDGVHVGHAEVIRQVVRQARGRGCRAAIATFDRHPAALLSEEPQPAITSLDHRLRLFERLGVDLCVVVEFTGEVAQIPAEQFARDMFARLLEAQVVVLGYDCRFGRDREGDVELCRRLGPELGFEVQSVPPVEVGGRPVSSTQIRQAILAGDFDRAERLLGRPFSLYGTVVPGEHRGRALGFPTANVDPHNEALPPDGVYAGWVFTDGHRVAGAVSIGRQETFHPADAPRVVEVHMIGHDEELYGRDIEIQFAEFLREQEGYADSTELAEQMARDVAVARRVLADHPPGC